MGSAQGCADPTSPAVRAEKTASGCLARLDNRLCQLDRRSFPSSTRPHRSAQTACSGLSSAHRRARSAFCHEVSSMHAADLARRQAWPRDRPEPEQHDEARQPLQGLPGLGVFVSQRGSGLRCRRRWSHTALPPASACSGGRLRRWRVGRLGCERRRCPMTWRGCG